VVEIPPDDVKRLIRMGFGPLANQPNFNYSEKSIDKQRINMEAEARDQLRRSTLTFKIVALKTDVDTMVANVPTKITF
jgi:hypothetical protein